MSTYIKPTILKPEEEEDIMQYITEKANKKERVSRDDIKKLILSMISSAKRKNPFRKGIPGDKWFFLFRQRHNEQFLKFDPETLKELDREGFSEKFRISSHSSSTGSPRERINRQGKMATPTTSDDIAYTPSGPPTFEIGSKLEVMDFNDKWYPVRVVEADFDDGDVLVHFEKWSDRFDEWVPMDSNRIRVPQTPLTPVPKKMFEVNEKVLAVWSYNQKFPATVRNVLNNGEKYEVLFSDGYAKILRACKLFKATEDDLKNAKLPSPKKPAPPMGADPIDPDLGPKEERRLKKRRMDVLESYLPHKKSKCESLPAESTPTSSYQPKEMPKVVLKRKGRPPKKRKPVAEDDDEDDNYYDETDEDSGEEESDDEEEEGDEKEKIFNKNENKKKEEVDVPEHEVKKEKVDDQIQKSPTSEPTGSGSIKVKDKKKKSISEMKIKYRQKQKQDEDDGELERWNTEIPEGASPVTITTDGILRESIIIPDKKLPNGWTKHTLPRKTGVKWDVILVNPKGRKFRSRQDLRAYFADRGEPFPEEKFDFMVGRKMELIQNKADNRKKCQLSSTDSPVDGKKPNVDSPKSVEATITPEPSKRIKTLLPRSRMSTGALPTLLQMPPPPFSLAGRKIY